MIVTVRDVVVDVELLLLPPELSRAVRFCGAMVDGTVIVVVPPVLLVLPWLLLLPWLLSLPLLAAAEFPTGRSKTVIVVEEEGDAPGTDVLMIGVRAASPVVPVNDEVPPNGANTSRPNGT